MFRVFLALTLLAPLGVSAASIRDAYTRYMEAGQFQFMREFFTGKEFDGDRIILRTDPAERAGRYFVVTLDTAVRELPAAAALSDVPDGATVMIGGFGEAGSPIELIHALIDQGASDLTVINNNTGSGEVGLAALIKAGRVSTMICSYPRTLNSTVFPELYRSGRTALDLVPQGTLAERIRAGGAGIPAFYTRTSVGTPLAEGKEQRRFDGDDYVMERGLTADFSLIKCRAADIHGNLVYNKTARNFGPLMATAGTVTIAQADEIVPLGSIDPECVVTPGIFVNRVVEVREPAQESDLVARGVSYP